jgi:glycosyltransferase involved in cell wall biosynthesis
MKESATQKLTILHIAPTPFFADRGCHIRIRNELEALQRHPVATLICTYHLGRDVEGIEARRIWPIPGYRKLDAGYSPFKFPADILLFFLVLKVCWQEKPDILHGHLHEGGLLGWAVKTCLFWRKMALVMDVQGSLSGELVSYGTLGGKQMLTRLVALVEGMICRLPDFFVCSSVQSRKALMDRFRVRPEKTMLLQDVVPDFFFAPQDKESLRAELGLPADRKIILYTGSLLPGKGISHLLAAMRRLLSERDDLFFVLVGYPVEEAGEFVSRHGLAGQVLLTGQVPYQDLARWLGIADIAVEPKDDDSGEASGKLLHYMAAGLPVACFDTRNNKKMLGGAGYYARSRDADGLVRVISDMLAHPRKAGERGRAGREIICSQYSMTAVASRLHQLYLDLVSGTDR